MKPEPAAFAHIIAGSLLAYAPVAAAYVGPGAGLGMIASIVAVVLAVLATIVGLVVWPIRRLMQRKKTGAAGAAKPPVDE